MKVEEIKCPACGGSIKIDKNDPTKAICDYCKSECYIEAAKISRPVQTQITVEERRPSSLLIALRVILVLGGLSAFITIGIAKITFDKGSKPNQVTTTDVALNSSVVEGNDLVWQDFIAQVFDKPYDLVNQEELDKITYLSVSRNSDGYQFDYRFNDPDRLAEEINLTTLSVTTSDSFNCSSINSLTNLKSLSLESQKPVAQDLNRLTTLEHFSSNYMSLEEIIDAVADVTMIKSLVLGSEVSDLQGIEVFTQLQKLELNRSELIDLTPIAANRELHTLTLNSCDELTDYSVLYVMNQLQELWIRSEGLKDIGFVEQMNDLTVFGVERSAIISLQPLAEKENLTQLSVIYNTDLADYSVISGLTGLTNLAIDKSLSQQDPDLSALTGLEYLAINGFDSITFLQNLGALTELNISSCQINDPQAFSGLTSLRTLSCGSFWGEIANLDFIASLPNLNYLDMAGVSLYGDVSALFNMPGLETLILSNGEFEINFANIRLNEVLKRLELNQIKLYTNVKVQQEGFVSYIDYDTVILDEHTSFLENFPSMERLSLSDNKLTNIDFAASLVKLESINIDQNYVTAIRPLEHLEFLAVVSCKGNPISNVELLRDEIKIIK